MMPHDVHLSSQVDFRASAIARHKRRQLYDKVKRERSRVIVGSAQTPMMHPGDVTLCHFTPIHPPIPNVQSSTGICGLCLLWLLTYVAACCPALQPPPPSPRASPPAPRFPGVSPPSPPLPPLGPGAKVVQFITDGPSNVLVPADSLRKTQLQNGMRSCST